MKRVGIICKKGRPEPDDILSGFVPWLSGRGITVYKVTEDQAVCDADTGGIMPCRAEELPSLVDMLVVLGGDGTMLWAARISANSGIPLLGVNLGRLGFITEVAVDELTSTMELILAGRYTIEERLMLSVGPPDGGRNFTALNDVVIHRGDYATLIDLEVKVSGRLVNVFKGDGIILATPTGSTGYSLSAAGPIIYPTLDAILLTPVCPHTLTNRPLVLPGDVAVEITLKSEGVSARFTHDGIVAGSLSAGDSLILTRSPYKASLIMPPGRDHFKVLRTKLKWGER